MPKKKLTPQQKKRRKLLREAKLRNALLEASPVVIPLLELFAECDDCFTTEDAFSPLHIHKTAGRIYRAWKKCRSELDPNFNPNDYPKKPRVRKKGKISKGLTT